MAAHKTETLIESVRRRARRVRGELHLCGPRLTRPLDRMAHHAFADAAAAHIYTGLHGLDQQSWLPSPRKRCQQCCLKRADDIITETGDVESLKRGSVNARESGKIVSESFGLGRISMPANLVGSKERDDIRKIGQFGPADIEVYCRVHVVSGGLEISAKRQSSQGYGLVTANAVRNLFHNP
ncbi:hypothetical protein J2Z19_004376 [Ensifer adhaerens]|uniref:Uncharacterized protein n=1 Tax=Ensifer adhaerens TaxID=106592 RepID=A0ACC5T0M0_ENSAD|nr:hypothetical protein [Ensifer adhaerens]